MRQCSECHKPLTPRQTSGLCSLCYQRVYQKRLRQQVKEFEQALRDLQDEFGDVTQYLCDVCENDAVVWGHDERSLCRQCAEKERQSLEKDLAWYRHVL